MHLNELNIYGFQKRNIYTFVRGKQQWNEFCT